MSWSARRFSRAHIFCALTLCLGLSAVVILEYCSSSLFEEREVKRAPEKPVSVAAGALSEIPSLQLHPIDLIDSKVNLTVPFQASAWVFRPGAMLPRRALCLRDTEKETERDVTEGKPIYLSQEMGRVAFAPLGEKTPLWGIARRDVDQVFFDIYMSVQGEDQLVKSVELTFNGAKPWPKEGVLARGVVVDRDLMKRVKATWYGKDELHPDRGERLLFKDRVCYARRGEWFAMGESGFLKVEKSTSIHEPLVQLKEIHADRLEFEIVDADAQSALYVELPRAEERVGSVPIEKLHFLGRRQLESVYLDVAGLRITAPLKALLAFSEGRWEVASQEIQGAVLLRLDRIETVERKERLHTTLFSPQRSHCRAIIFSKESL